MKATAILRRMRWRKPFALAVEEQKASKRRMITSQ
jgi:hypothetical protein